MSSAFVIVSFILKIPFGALQTGDADFSPHVDDTFAVVYREDNFKALLDAVEEVSFNLDVGPVITGATHSQQVTILGKI